ncbi:hypothetical protein HY990_07255 [Candidatus Micrarchaeota archaeon]|nr:hypothetical protein [Candidatus Micrarchaeota archaeon]
MGTHHTAPEPSGIITQIPTFEPTGVSANRHIPPVALDRARHLATVAGADPMLVATYLQNSQVDVGRNPNGTLDVRVTLSPPNPFGSISPEVQNRSRVFATRLLEIAYREGVSTGNTSFDFQLGPTAQRFVEQRANQNNIDPAAFRDGVIVSMICNNDPHFLAPTRIASHELSSLVTDQFRDVHGPSEYSPILSTTDVIVRGTRTQQRGAVVFDITQEQSERGTQVITTSREIPQANRRLVEQIGTFMGIDPRELVAAVENMTVAHRYTNYGTAAIDAYPVPAQNDPARRTYEVASLILRYAYSDRADRRTGEFSEEHMLRALTYVAYQPNLFVDPRLPVQMDPPTRRWINQQASYYGLPESSSRLIFAYTLLATTDTGLADRFLRMNIERMRATPNEQERLNPESERLLSEFVPVTAGALLREHTQRYRAGERTPAGQQTLLSIGFSGMHQVQTYLAELDRTEAQRRRPA